MTTAAFTPAPIRVEFYGIPRRRTGVAAHLAPWSDQCSTLGELLESLLKHFPQLAADCIENASLREGCAANLGGQQFVRDPLTRLRPGDCVLLMSADAGG